MTKGIDLSVDMDYPGASIVINAPTLTVHPRGWDRLRFAVQALLGRAFTFGPSVVIRESNITTPEGGTAIEINGRIQGRD